MELRKLNANDYDELMEVLNVTFGNFNKRLWTF